MASRFVAPPERGALPRVPQRTELPPAEEAWRFRLVAIPGGVGVADTVYVCLKDASDQYAWEVVATG